MSKHPTPLQPYGSQDFDVELSNSSDNPHFNDILETNLKRRGLLKGGLGLAVAAGLFASPLAQARELALGAAANRRRPPGTALGFQAVPVGRADTIVVPEGYRVDTILKWGEPILGDYPPYLDGGLNTGAEQEQQIGMNHDGMHYFPLRPGTAGNIMGLLVMNHEYIEQAALHPEGQVIVGGSRLEDDVRKEIAAHGVSVTQIGRQANRWGIMRSRYNRRITGATPMRLSGPAAGHAKLRTAYSPDGTRTRGTLNNCAHGVTPWGTYLTCEENWAGYFVNRDAQRPREHARYGVATVNSRYRWDTVEPRFNASSVGASALDDYRNEPNGFGWIVEIDPFDPSSTPVKRTALGRFAHEGVVFADPVAGQPLALYSGDDARNEYIYKFVTRDVWTPSVSNGSILDDGTLYVAKFHDDGTGEWIALDFNDPAFQAACQDAGVVFDSQGDVLLNTRLAADAVGATRMDRPEWGAIDPVSGAVYFTLTNNSNRGPGDVDEANPRGPNPYGHIIRFTEFDGAPDALGFDWDIFCLAGTATDSLGPDGQPLNDDNIFASPDGLWFQPNGLLWIQTDMSGGQLNNGPFGNNAMLACNVQTGEIKRFLVGPPGCEVTGVVATPDQRTLFVNIQHPGDSGNSNWPDGGDRRPRSATVVVTKVDQGIVGT